MRIPTDAQLLASSVTAFGRQQTYLDCLLPTHCGSTDKPSSYLTQLHANSLPFIPSVFGNNVLVASIVFNYCCL